jgi:hypothetical protein
MSVGERQPLSSGKSFVPTREYLRPSGGVVNPGGLLCLLAQAAGERWMLERGTLCGEEMPKNFTRTLTAQEN